MKQNGLKQGVEKSVLKQIKWNCIEREDTEMGSILWWFGFFRRI